MRHHTTEFAVQLTEELQNHTYLNFVGLLIQRCQTHGLLIDYTEVFREDFYSKPVSNGRHQNDTSIFVHSPRKVPSGRRWNYRVCTSSGIIKKSIFEYFYGMFPHSQSYAFLTRDFHKTIKIKALSINVKCLGKISNISIFVRWCYLRLVSYIHYFRMQLLFMY